MAVQNSQRRVALITGVTGQDGAYLAEYLLGLGYTVHGIKRRSSSFNTARVDHLYQDRHAGNVPFLLHYGDMTDSTNLIRLMQQIRPTEIYNLAAQSHVGVSFESPEYTANADAHRRAAPAGGDPHPRHGKGDAVLSGVDLGAVRPGAGSAAEGDHAVLSALALRRRKTLWLLDHGELPRGLRHVRLQRHPVQSREPDPRRDLRHPQDHARRGPHRDWAWKTRSISAISKPSATGAMPGIMSRACTDPAGGCARRFRAGDRRDALGARIRRAGVRRSRPQHRVARQGRRGDRHRQEDRQDRRAHRSALFPPDRGRSSDRRRQQGAGETGLEAEDDVRRTRQGDGGERSRRPPGGRPPMARTPFELERQDGLRRRPSRHGRVGAGAAARAGETSNS